MYTCDKQDCEGCVPVRLLSIAFRGRSVSALFDMQWRRQTVLAGQCGTPNMRRSSAAGRHNHDPLQPSDLKHTSLQASGSAKNQCQLLSFWYSGLIKMSCHVFVLSLSRKSGKLFVLGMCRERPPCSHHTPCLCMTHAKGTVCALTDAKITVCALTRHFVGAGQMQRVQCVHSPDAVPGLIACMQTAARAAAACTTAGQIWACSSCMAMTTFISSSSSGFSTLEYCRLSKLPPEGASEPLLTSEGGAAILHIAFYIKN